MKVLNEGTEKPYPMAVLDGSAALGVGSLVGAISTPEEAPSPVKTTSKDIALYYDIAFAVTGCSR